MWHGVQHLINYRAGKLSITECNAALAEELNNFFTCFEVPFPNEGILHTPTHSNYIYTVEEREVMQILKAVNPWKTVGPDGITGQVLKDYAVQLLYEDFQRVSLSVHDSTLSKVLYYSSTD